MPTIYPGATYRPAANHSGPMNAHLGLVLHVQVGENDLGNEFNNPASQASYTWVAYEDGHGDQFVDADMTAWAEAAGNGTYDSCGTQGFPDTPLTEACCQWIAGLYRWGHDRYGWPYVLAEVPGEPGFGWHGMGGDAWGGHPSCPGDLRKAQRQHILDLAQSQGDPDMAFDDGAAKKLDDIWQALTNTDAASEPPPSSRPIPPHWVWGYTWSFVQRIAKDVAAIRAKLGA